MAIDVKKNVVRGLVALSFGAAVSVGFVGTADASCANPQSSAEMQQCSNDSWTQDQAQNAQQSPQQQYYNDQVQSAQQQQSVPTNVPAGGQAPANYDATNNRSADTLVLP